MTERDIIRYLSEWTDDRRFPWQLANSFIYLWESDFWTMTAKGETREFEIKISRADYLKDAKKIKHNTIAGANYFYYVCPINMIRKTEVDKRYGLIYVSDGGYLDIVKKPRILHANKFDRWQILANKMYWKFRVLWREKYMANEISRIQYRSGFNMELMERELS